MPITLDGTLGITTPSYGGADAAEYLVPVTAFKNRIINGAMVIAQRGTSFSFASGGGALYYAADRFSTQDYHWSAGTNPTISNDTSVVPTGFTNSYKYATGATGLTFNAGGVQYVRQDIEGFNIADCYSGNITISFWVRASTAGQYNIMLTNNANSIERYSTRNYTINSANTWEYKTITVDLSAGIASGGTWNTTNGTGLCLQFLLGAASNRTGNTGLNTWATGGSPNYDYQTTGSVNLSTIANSTFYLTGVQVEKGSTATSFDYRPYGTELALCQRYTYIISGTSTFANGFARYIGFGNGTNQFLFFPQFPVQMRTPPTLISSNFINSSLDLYNYSTTASTALNSIALGEGDVWHSQVTFFCTSAGSIVSGNICSWRWSGNPNAYIGFSAEL